MRLLIVEDDRDTAEALMEILADITEGHECLYAANGSECLAMVAARPPDLVLMDGYLGEPYQGPEVIRMLRARGCAAKVIMVSYAPEMIVEGLQAGADAACAKNDVVRLLPVILARFGIPVRS